ncbi:MAG: MBL fold metallo-hydrolase [Pseudomonadales bacterium]|nr:MBL fold metallo-hydrolase [Pseudomonadales bacterium]
MKIVRIYMDNSLNNYCHLIICEETNEAVVLDPLDANKCLTEAERQSCKITKIVNTHEHFDHIDGNPDVVEATGAVICAHKNATDSIPNVGVALEAGDVVEVGTTVRLRVLYTPGHTLAHLCLVSEIGEPALFCGDTLFNASAGNCKFGGDVNLMYQTFVDQLALLPDDTQIYPGHDYMVNNLNFSLSREPGNAVAKQQLDESSQQSPDTRTVTTLGIEKQINPFFRLDNPEIVRLLKEEFEEQQADPQSVFVSLRRLRDNW